MRSLFHLGKKKKAQSRAVWAAMTAYPCQVSQDPPHFLFCHTLKWQPVHRKEGENHGTKDPLTSTYFSWARRESWPLLAANDAGK